ncbi:MAG: HNH endonuclease [Anaerolineae bacterium]|nr:HNH endonuclease [Anaerolineae bacterium]
MPKITFNCLNCGKEVQKYGSQAIKYCSHQCYTEHKAKISFEKICPVCHKTFLGKVSQVYCSKSCRQKRQHEKEISDFLVRCPRCGKERKIKRPNYRKEMTLCKRCSGLQARATTPLPTGKDSHAWKGGRRFDKLGYVKLHQPGHPYADSTNYVREHIYVVCEAYGVDFFEKSGATVHHINGDKRDNRLENLYVCTSAQNKKYNADLLNLAFELVKRGVIKFVDGEYRCPLLSDEPGEASQIR